MHVDACRYFDTQVLVGDMILLIDWSMPMERVSSLLPCCSRCPPGGFCRCVPPLIAMCRDHEALNLQQFEGLLALTNLASMDNVKGRIIAEKGISCLQYLQVTSLQWRSSSIPVKHSTGPFTCISFCCLVTFELT